MLSSVRAEEALWPGVVAFVEGAEFVLGDLRAERIGIGIDTIVAVGPAHTQAVVEALFAARNAALEQGRDEALAGRQVEAARFQGRDGLAGRGVEYIDRVGARQQGAQP